MGLHVRGDDRFPITAAGFLSLPRGLHCRPREGGDPHAAAFKITASGRKSQLPLPDSDFSLIPASVALGVMASGSILRWMIDGLPEARAAANAAGKSALFSTTAP